mmetsp:Transcript_30641/g.65823  ORF Transcript_30641/g.65823 Transcript_30641/m.65823 type:complete len:223 (+) Transcript_30641:296-964(+)
MDAADVYGSARPRGVLGGAHQGGRAARHRAAAGRDRADDREPERPRGGHTDAAARGSECRRARTGGLDGAHVRCAQGAHALPARAARGGRRRRRLHHQRRHRLDARRTQRARGLRQPAARGGRRSPPRGRGRIDRAHGGDRVWSRPLHTRAARRRRAGGRPREQWPDSPHVRRARRPLRVHRLSDRRGGHGQPRLRRRPHRADAGVQEGLRSERAHADRGWR